MNERSISTTDRLVLRVLQAVIGLILVGGLLWLAVHHGNAGNSDIAEVQATHNAAITPASDQDVLKERLDRNQERLNLLASDATATTNAEGRFTMETTYVGIATLQASWPGLPPAQTTIDIPEHDTAIQIDVAEMVVG